jgi:hypothetical protein
MTDTKLFPAAYEWVERWGQHLGSHTAFIREQQRLAAHEGAPVDAIYRDSSGAWRTLADVSNASTLQAFRARGWLPWT